MSATWETRSEKHSRLFRTKMTRHAEKRANQRSIPLAIVDALRDCCDPIPAGGGAESYSFTKRSWRKAQAYWGPQAKYFERYRNVYVIVSSEGNVITAAWRH